MPWVGRFAGQDKSKAIKAALVKVWCINGREAEGKKTNQEKRRQMVGRLCLLTRVRWKYIESL